MHKKICVVLAEAAVQVFCPPSHYWLFTDILIWSSCVHLRLQTDNFICKTYTIHMHFAFLTFNGRMLDISHAACTPQWPMLDISNAVHVCIFSALTVFTWAGNPNKSAVVPTTRPGIRQEPWCHLWRSGYRYHLCVELTFGDQLREWQTQHNRPLFEGET